MNIGLTTATTTIASDRIDILRWQVEDCLKQDKGAGINIGRKKAFFFGKRER